MRYSWDIPHISYNSMSDFDALYIPLYNQNNPFGPLFHCSVFGRQHSAPPRRRFHRVWMVASPPRLSPATEGAAPSSVWQGPWMRHHEMMDIPIPRREKGRLGKWRILLKAHQKNENPFVNFKNHIYIYIFFCLSGVTLSKASTRIGISFYSFNFSWDFFWKSKPSTSKQFSGIGNL